MLNLQVSLVIGAYALVFAAALLPCAKPLFGILQQEGYCGGAFLSWYCAKKKMLRRRYGLLSLCSVLVMCLFGVCFSFLGAVWADVAAAVGFVGLCLLFVFAFRIALKVPVRRTNRLIRANVCCFVLLAACIFGAGAGIYCAAEAIGTDLARAFRSAIAGLFPALLFLLVWASNALMKVYEIPHSRRLIGKAAKTIAASPCVKVGVTGSFGKTGVKTAAARILGTKYRVKATPASYNTPIGIAKFVNEEGLDCDIFLAEMGARHTGDIRELCEMVRPTYGVVTGVCPQHLETFKTLDAIVAEKGELARAAQHVILGETACGMREDALKEGADFAAEDVEIFGDRTCFTLRLGEERARVETSLLGRQAAENVALAAALCHSLGMTLGEIAAAIPALTPVPHRLERSVSGGVVILDDSYNSNPAGAARAVEVLKRCGGKRVVVTPGLVELGEIEEEANTALGRELVGLDLVILVGETLVLPVRNGYLDGGGEESKLAAAPDLAAAQEILSGTLRAGDTVLFLNDLPDKY